MWIDFNTKQPQLNSEIRVKFDVYDLDTVINTGVYVCIIKSKVLILHLSTEQLFNTNPTNPHPTMLKIGDKVVCVRSSILGTIKEGEIHKIQNIAMYPEGLGLNFYNIEPAYGFVAFAAINFNKLDDTFATETLERIKEEIEEKYLIIR